MVSFKIKKPRQGGGKYAAPTEDAGLRAAPSSSGRGGRGGGRGGRGGNDGGRSASAGGGRGGGRGGRGGSRGAVRAGNEGTDRRAARFQEQQHQQQAQQQTGNVADQHEAALDEATNRLNQDNDGFFGGLGRARSSAQGGLNVGGSRPGAEGAIWKPHTERDEDGRSAPMVPVKLLEGTEDYPIVENETGAADTTNAPDGAQQLQTKVLWLELGLCKALTRAVAQLGFLAPTPVQAKAIPPALQGLDLCVRAVTGSGKTAAFLLPILHRLLTTRGYKQDNMKGKRKFIRGLVLTPSRELGTQCHDMCRRLLEFTSSVETALAIGGVAQSAQTAALEKAPELVIATPGRLCDLMMNYKGPHGSIDFSGVEVVAVDEVDKMLTVTMKEQLEKILDQCPEETRQTMFFSATMTKEVDEFATDLLVQPRNIEVGHVALQSQLKQQFIRVKGTGTSKFPKQEKKAAAAAAKKKAAVSRAKRGREGEEEGEEDQEEEQQNEEDVEDFEDDIDSDEDAAPVDPNSEEPQILPDHATKVKTRHLVAACRNFYPRALIFAKYRTTAHRLAILFNALGMKAADLQGNQSQEERFASYSAFSEKKINYLVCTDVASRGLDIPNVEVVINYDMPPTLTAYIHRVGRTARVGTKGTAVSLVDETQDADLMRKIIGVSSNVNSHQVATVKRRDISDEALLSAATEIDKVFQEVKSTLANEVLDEKLKEAEKKITRQIATLERKGPSADGIEGGAAALLGQAAKKQWVLSKKEKAARDEQSKKTLTTAEEVRTIEEANRELADVAKTEKKIFLKSKDINRRKKEVFERKKEREREDRRAIRKKQEAKIQKGLIKKEKTKKIRQAIKDKRKAKMEVAGNHNKRKRSKPKESKARHKKRSRGKMKKH